MVNFEDERLKAAALVKERGISELVELVFRDTFDKGARVDVFVGAEVACLSATQQARIVNAFIKAADWRREEQKVRKEEREFNRRVKAIEKFLYKFLVPTIRTWTKSKKI